MVDLTTLNDNQLKAVEWQDGGLLVLAGPGSGKTRVLTTRIARLLSASNGQHFKVLGLTFTSKAAAEMRERVEEDVREQRNRSALTTFHSFAAEVLRQHGSSVGLRPDFTILTQDADRTSTLTDAVRALRSAGVTIDHDPKDLLPLIDFRFAQGYDAGPIELDGFPDYFGGLFQEYVAQLSNAGRADFATLLWLCHRLLIERPAVAKQLRLIYRYVCVDEFQDTNLAQYRLLTTLVGPPPTNLFVVADDDQIIYQWNGASPERLLALRQDYSMQVVQLPENYRCPSDVIALANALIAHNRTRAQDKLPLVAKRSTVAQSYRLMRFPSERDEVNWIPTDMKARGLEPSSCVVLARTNKLVEAAADAARSQGLQAHVTRRKSEFSSAPMRWLHAVLRLANARHDAEQLRRVCKSWFDLTEQSVRPEEIEPRAVLVGGDFLREWAVAAAAATFDEILVPLQRSLVDRLEFLSFLDVVMSWLQDQHDALGGEGFAEFEDERATWQDLQSRIVGKFGRDEISLHQFLQEMDLEPKAAAPHPTALRCMTAHSAKGLEFDHVYLIGLVEDQLPSFQAKKRGDMSTEMEEERRNCFVAITRVQASLTLTFAQSYGGWAKQPSRFLEEMGFKLDNWEPIVG